MVTFKVGQTNQTLSKLYNNMDLVVNALSVLTGREDTITIRKNTGAVSFVPTKSENDTILTIIFAIPMLVIVTGIIVKSIRKKR